MTYSQLLYHVRQYSQLAARTKRDYSPQVDHLVSLYEARFPDQGEAVQKHMSEVRGMVDREYSTLYRSFPPAKTL